MFITLHRYPDKAEVVLNTDYVELLAPAEAYSSTYPHTFITLRDGRYEVIETIDQIFVRMERD